MQLQWASLRRPLLLEADHSHDGLAVDGKLASELGKLAVGAGQTATEKAATSLPFPLPAALPAHSQREAVTATAGHAVLARASTAKYMLQHALH